MKRPGLLVLAVLLGACGHDVAPTREFATEASVPRPENFTATLEFGRVNLAWESQEGVFGIIDGWYLSRAFGTDPRDLGPYRRLNDVPHQEHVYVDVHVEDGYYYAYRIRSVTPAEILSEPEETLILVDLTPPPAPTGVGAVQEQRDGSPVVIVSWDAVPGEEFPNYHLFRLPPFPTFDRVVTPATSFADFAVEPLLTYRYWVLAVDQAGNESGPSEIVVIQVQP